MDETSIAIVKNIFTEVGIPEQYEKFEKENQRQIMSLIVELPKKVPKLAFYIYTTAIFNRVK